MTDNLTEADISALRRSVEIARLDSKKREWIDAQLAQGADWTDIAISCASSAQYKSLELKPWETAPCFGHVDRPRRDEHAFGLLQKLLSLNLSRFEPHPLQAIELAEANRLAPATAAAARS